MLNRCICLVIMLILLFQVGCAKTIIRPTEQPNFHELLETISEEHGENGPLWKIKITVKLKEETLLVGHGHADETARGMDVQYPWKGKKITGRYYVSLFSEPQKYLKIIKFHDPRKKVKGWQIWNTKYEIPIEAIDEIRVSKIKPGEVNFLLCGTGCLIMFVDFSLK